MKITSISISKTRTIAVDGVFDKQTKYIKVGITMNAELENELEVEGEVKDQTRELSRIVDDAIKEEIMKYKK